MQTCSVLGLGYIGLPTAVLLANSNYNVIGVDINPKIIEKINKGSSHFFEKDLDDLLKKAINDSKLQATLNPTEADIHIIAVPTPLNSSDNIIPQPNIDFVLDAAKSISSKLKKGNLVIIESTSPIGTTNKVAELIFRESKLNADEIHFAYCPERVIPGNMMHELVHNNRVIGGLTSEA